MQAVPSNLVAGKSRRVFLFELRAIGFRVAGLAGWIMRRVLLPRAENFSRSSLGSNALFDSLHRIVELLQGIGYGFLGNRNDAQSPL